MSTQKCVTALANPLSAGLDGKGARRGRRAGRARGGSSSPSVIDRLWRAAPRGVVLVAGRAVTTRPIAVHLNTLQRSYVNIMFRWNPIRDPSGTIKYDITEIDQMQKGKYSISVNKLHFKIRNCSREPVLM
ncbi:hypothetical protein EVAR_70175_1 [Eumeta japonica]|uniref:Uncharacterized protein n=1 Tax=Eumeta variegata TaxID=151549 RepID=A0A4C1T3T2_EUMVA|nr:hypothetical protein EVAR_70175_1 [Eumeta japonica]